MRRARLAILLLAACPASAAMQVTSATVARTFPPGVLMPRIPVEAESEFLTTDAAAFYLLLYTGARKDDKLRVEWRGPSGAVVQENDHTQILEGPVLRLVERLPIAGAPAALAPGNWQVTLFYNGQSLATNTFRITAPPETVVSIGTRTLMPDATVSVPYFLQLTARGGKAPYHWGVVKPLPAGLALSDTGVVSGAPARRGSYRAIVTFKDSAGNSVARTFGIGIGVAAPPEMRAAWHLLKSAGADACTQTASQTDFSASDPEVVLAMALQAPRGREGRLEWLNPRGEVYQSAHLTKAAEAQECLVKTLSLAAHRAAQLPGEWRVRLFLAGMEVFTTKFTVSPAKAGTVARAPVRTGRLAILIANRRYDKLPAVKSPADLDALAAALGQDGFEVVRTSDASLDNLRAIEHTLEDKLQSGDIALVYYSGYDARTGGDYWLLPANFDPAAAGPMPARAYSALRLLQWLEDSKASLKFIFLDGAVPPGQPSENLGAVMGEVDESTALVYSRNPAPGALAHALAEVLSKPDLDARTALGIELPKAANNPAPVAILGGGADFIFRSH